MYFSITLPISNTGLCGNWIEIAYGTKSGSVRVIVQHPETVGHGPQLFQTFTVHQSSVTKVRLMSLSNAIIRRNSSGRLSNQEYSLQYYIRYLNSCINFVIGDALRKILGISLFGIQSCTKLGGDQIPRNDFNTTGVDA